MFILHTSQMDNIVNNNSNNGNNNISKINNKSDTESIVISELWEKLFLKKEFTIIKKEIHKIKDLNIKEFLSQILSFIEQTNPDQYLEKLSTVPIIIYFQIFKYIEKKQIQKATILLIKKKDIFFKISRIFREYITLLQIKIIKLLFENQYYHLVKEVSLIIFTQKDDLYYMDIQLTIGSILLGCAMNRQSIEAFIRVYHHPSANDREKAKACFFLGGIFEIEQKKNESLLWFNRGIKFNQNLWSMMCGLKLKKKPKVISKYQLIPNIHSSKNDYFLDMAIQKMYQGDFKQAIDFIYSLKKSYFISFSPKLIDCIERFSLSHDPCCLLKIGVLMFRYTGKIIKECLPIPGVLLDLYNNGHINKRFIPLASAIIHEESKFYQSSYYNLDNGYALGIMQVAPEEAKRICNTLRINYNRKFIICNNRLNVLLAQECIKEFNKYTNNRMFFNLLYYNAGNIGNIYLRKFRFLDLDNPVLVLILLDVLQSKRIKKYLEGVFEFYIVSYTITMNEILDFDFLCKNCL